MWLFTHLPIPLEESPVADAPTYTKPEPVRLLGSITTGLTTFFGGITLVAGLQDNKTVALVAGIGMLVTAAVNAAKDEYVRKNVTPSVDVAAYRNASGTVVTGAAAAAPENLPADVVAGAAVDPKMEGPQ
jgi:hypothetical protein